MPPNLNFTQLPQQAQAQMPAGLPNGQPFQMPMGFQPPGFRGGVFQLPMMPRPMPSTAQGTPAPMMGMPPGMGMRPQQPFAGNTMLGMQTNPVAAQTPIMQKSQFGAPAPSQFGSVMQGQQMPLQNLGGSPLSGGFFGRKPSY